MAGAVVARGAVQLGKRAAKNLAKKKVRISEPSSNVTVKNAGGTSVPKGDQARSYAKEVKEKAAAASERSKKKISSSAKKKLDSVRTSGVGQKVDRKASQSKAQAYLDKVQPRRRKRPTARSRAPRATGRRSSGGNRAVFVDPRGSGS
jgi:hypothetical protein